MPTPFVPPKSKINKEELIRLRKEQSAQATAKEQAANTIPSGARPEDAALLRSRDWIKPEDATDKLRIIFDNSGSRNGAKLQAEKDGVVEFLRNCTPNSTAIAIHLLNPEGSSKWDYSSGNVLSLPLPTNIEKSKMTADIILLASEITEPSIHACGGTPLYETIEKALASAEPRATRLIAFSDGAPSWVGNKDSILQGAKRASIPIDTVFICSPHEPAWEHASAIAEMKYIAEMTGGIFLDLSKGDIKSGLKYLAPVKRLMLADSSFKSKVERGEVK